MVPKVNGQNIQFLVVQPLYLSSTIKEKDDEGKKIYVQKDKFVKEHYLKVWMCKNDINPYGEYIGAKGTKLKNRTRIYNRSTNSYSNVAHTLKELEEVLHPCKVGF